MRLEACVVCVGYADFLAVTLPRNLHLFDRMVIVTDPADTETRELCRRYGVDTLLSEDHKRDGASFNKARLINRGIDQLSASDWIVHLDADIVLPPHFRRALDWAELDEHGIYGCDRAMVQNWTEWQRFLQSEFLQHDYWCRVNFPPGLKVGSRWASVAYGYVPIGFFQMWHHCSDLYRGIHMRHYPTDHSDAARTDVQFALQWDRCHRHLLPEIVAIHLESEAAALGANWSGRTTKRFGPR